VILDVTGRIQYAADGEMSLDWEVILILVPGEGGRLSFMEDDCTGARLTPPMPCQFFNRFQARAQMP